MKFCYQCGEKLLNEMKFCPKCGANNSVETGGTSKQAELRPNESTGNQHGSKRTILIILCVALVLCLAFVITVLIYKEVEKKRGSTVPTSGSHSALSDSPETPESEWKRAFAEYFEEIKREDGFNAFSDACVTDLDGDDIPEVLGGWRDWQPMVAFYDDGVVKEARVPDDNVVHSSSRAGEFPNLLYFDVRNHIVIYRCEGRNQGTMFERSAIAYRYSKGVFTKYKEVVLDLSPDDFDGYSDEAYISCKERFEEQFQSFASEFTLTAFEDAAVYAERLLDYLSKCFDYDIGNVVAAETTSATTQATTTQLTTGHTDAKPEEHPISYFLGKTTAEAVKQFGNNYKIDGWITMESPYLEYEDRYVLFSWIDDNYLDSYYAEETAWEDLKITGTETVKGIVVYNNDSTTIIDDITSEMTFDQIANRFDVYIANEEEIIGDPVPYAKCGVAFEYKGIEIVFYYKSNPSGADKAMTVYVYRDPLSGAF